MEKRDLLLQKILGIHPEDIRKAGDKRITLLGSFIADRLAAYVEPQRKGTPKGEPIGFSGKKYRASLLLLTNYPRPRLASALGIAYGTLRNWLSEEKFKEIRNGHRKAFIETWFLHLKKRIQVKEELREKFFNKTSLEDIASGKRIPDLGFDEYRDFLRYDIGVLLRLITTDWPEGGESLQQELIAMEHGSIFIDRRPLKEQRKLYPQEAIQKATSILRKNTLEKARQALMKPDISERERKEVVYDLSFALSLEKK